MRGKTLSLRPNAVHGGIFGPSGGVFMSIQHWLNDLKPRCVAADYNGPVMGKDHVSKVKMGKPVMVEQSARKKSTAATGEL